MNHFQNRRERVYDWMAAEGVALLMLEDREGARDPSIRYLTDHPSDALLFLSVTRKCFLVPWDINLAQKRAQIDLITAFTDFERNPLMAAANVASFFKTPHGARVEIPSITPYPLFLRYVEALHDWDVICHDGGATDFIAAMRAVKDDGEIEIIRQASRITNEVIELLEAGIRSGRLSTELETALFIESAARERGCEGTGFETLAAGPERSFGIHAFPAYTAARFASEGLSILDFGLKYEGYTTDVTLTVARGPLGRTQERMLKLVEKAYDQALALVKDGTPTREISLIVDAVFSQGKKAMPHALGHGIGLEAHEFPALRSRADNGWVLAAGMVFTLEPGLYDPKYGGCRLENDILLTPQGPEVLTTARIIRI